MDDIQTISTGTASLSPIDPTSNSPTVHEDQTEALAIALATQLSLDTATSHVVAAWIEPMFEAMRQVLDANQIYAEHAEEFLTQRGLLHEFETGCHLLGDHPQVGTARFPAR